MCCLCTYWRKIEEKKKKRKKEKIQKGSLDQTMFKQMCRIVKSKKKGKATWLKPKGCMKQSSSWLPTKSLCPLLLRGEPKRKRKRKNKKKAKAKTPKNQSSHQNPAF